MPFKRQASLSSFFTKAKSTKTTSGQSAGSDSSSTPKTSASKTVSLSPEQKERIKASKAKALAKKLAKLGPLGQLPGTWGELLQDELTKPYFTNLLSFLKSEYGSKTIFPPQKEVYEALRRCDASKVKVVIIGQDPYHNHNQAHGLCFSVRHGIRPPPSLKNIYKELATDLGEDQFSIPTHGCLEKWADRGVLLLNSCLTVQAHKAYSHRKQGWEKFTDAIISKLNRHGGEGGKPIVFLCWGKPAQTKALHIDKKKHTVLTSSHPSPLGATKTSKPFITSRCFSKCNAALEAHGLEPIDWSL